MKLTTSRDALHAALGRVAKIVERRTTIPVLSHVLLTARDGLLRLTGTDLDMTATTACDATIATAGHTTAPAALLADIVARFPAGSDVTLTLEGTTLQVRAGRARMTLNVLPPDDFPDFGPREATHTFALAAADLAALIDRTAFAISTEETRYYLGGIYLHAIDGHLRAVATDGHRLARFDIACPAGADGLPGIILPRKAALEIRRLLKDTREPATMAVGHGHITATIGTGAGATRLDSKLIDGTFPDYQRVIPQGNARRATLPRAAVVGAVDRVACVASERGRAVKLTFADGGLTLAVRSPDHGDGSEDLDIAYEAAPLEIGFNAAYLTELLGTLAGDRVHLDLDSPGSPALFREEAGDALLVVLMPMRV